MNVQRRLRKTAKRPLVVDMAERLIEARRLLYEREQQAARR